VLVTDRPLDWLTPRVSPVRLGGSAPAPIRGRVLRKDSPLVRLDWILILAVGGLCALGCLLVWSATRQKQLDLGLSPTAYLKKDLFNIAVGTVLAIGAATIDYRHLRSWAPVVYVASLFGLMAVLVVGATINGAHSWIVLPGGFEAQPSEFAKVALVVGMAMILSERRDGKEAPRTSDVLLVLALAAVPLGLIMLQPDFGTMMVFVFTIMGGLAISGVSARWVGGLALAGVLAGTVIIAGGLLKTYQQDRLTSFAKTDPSTLSTTAYNVDQAKTAIGSGGFSGKGLFDGTQTRGYFVPEQQTDFVFTVAGEEMGFVGAGLLLVLLGTVLMRGLRIAATAGDAFGSILAASIVTWWVFQAFVNVGMTLGIMPVTGLPLPFVSYGGSAMMANLLGAGLLLNVHLRSPSR
jgi:rod shape determining protein RodA